MRKDFEIAGLESLSAADLVKTNGGAKGGQSAAHSNANAALTASLAKLTANGANQHAIDAHNKNIAKHPV
jgi:hypothetical protein